MATKERTLYLKRRANSFFSEVTMKQVEAIELRPHGKGYEIGILFLDRTYLSFEIQTPGEVHHCP
jgi:hypothetical protein